MKDFLDDMLAAPFSEPFLTKREISERAEGFILYSKLGADFYSTSGLLYWILTIRLQLIRASLNFHISSDKPIVSQGIVDWSLYNHRTVLKDEYHKKQMDKLENVPVCFNVLET